jgi:hypothetical protein
MKLREHLGIIAWPPNWLSLSGSQEKEVHDDSARLTDVVLSQVNPITICYLTTQIDDLAYMGRLLCRDSNVCRTIYAVLQKNIGKRISEIAELELPDDPGIA